MDDQPDLEATGASAGLLHGELFSAHGVAPVAQLPAGVNVQRARRAAASGTGLAAADRGYERRRGDDARRRALGQRGVHTATVVVSRRSGQATRGFSLTLPLAAPVRVAA